MSMRILPELSKGLKLLFQITLRRIQSILTIRRQSSRPFISECWYSSAVSPLPIHLGRSLILYGPHSVGTPLCIALSQGTRL